jgi:hypothetical protein
MMEDIHQLEEILLAQEIAAELAHRDINDPTVA